MRNSQEHFKAQCRRGWLAVKDVTSNADACYARLAVQSRLVAQMLQQKQLSGLVTGVTMHEWGATAELLQEHLPLALQSPGNGALLQSTGLPLPPCQPAHLLAWQSFFATYPHCQAMT